MYNIIVIICSIIIPIFILRKEFKKEKLSDWIKTNKFIFLIYILLVIGFMVRSIGIVDYPNGLNTDEASIGYEAYSLLNYGIDRNGDSWPLFLESWGSGQNALYMYIIMPFVKILGLSVFSVRLPMAIIGCISLILMYKLFKKVNANKKFILIGMAFFVITPWHIMKSRYGLESNAFPDFVLWAVYLFISALQDKKIYKLYLSSVIFGICAYSYGTSYYFLPMFLIPIFIIFIRKKEITLKQALISIMIVFVISLPIILMIIINTFDLGEIHIWKFTIPRLTSNRYETLTVLSSNNIFKTLMQNFSKSIQMIAFQNDGFNANTLNFFGITYVFSLPITIIGVLSSFRKKENVNIVFNAWFIVTIMLLFICEPNINRMNIMYIPLIYYTILGIYEIIRFKHKYGYILVSIYIIAFVAFELTYFKTDFNKTYTFCNNIENVIKYTKNIEAKTIYFQPAFKEPYIYILFYNKEDTNEFVNTVKYKNNIKNFNSVEAFGKYIFSLPKDIQNDEDIAYVMLEKEKEKYEINENIWNKTYIDNFIVLEKKER